MVKELPEQYHSHAMDGWKGNHTFCVSVLVTGQTTINRHLGRLGRKHTKHLCVNISLKPVVNICRRGAEDNNCEYKETHSTERRH